MAAQSQDKIFFGAALVLLLASAGWMASQSPKIAKLSTSTEVNITPSIYEPSGIDAPTVATKTWPPAPSQSGGPLWVYDVFTPPEIYYDAATAKFTVTPPPPPEKEIIREVAPPPFGVELVGIRQDSFRLQLVGYIGGPDDYRGNFENSLSGETIIGRAGKKIPDLGLTIKSFKVEQKRILTDESMPIIVIEATAVIVDDKTGEEIELTNLARRTRGEPFAVFKETGSPRTFEHKAGATFTIRDASFTVVSVTSEPPSAEIRKEAPELTEPLTKTLTPGVSDAPVAPSPAAPEQPAASTPFPFGN